MSEVPQAKIEIKSLGPDQAALLSIPATLTLAELAQLAEDLIAFVEANDPDYKWHREHRPDNTLPYQEFKRLKARLDILLARVPGQMGAQPWSDPWLGEINTLCRRLGY